MLGGYSWSGAGSGARTKGASVCIQGCTQDPPAGPTRVRPRPGGPHPKSFFLSPISGGLSTVRSPRIGSHRGDPHDKAVSTSRERHVWDPDFPGDFKRGSVSRRATRVAPAPGSPASLSVDLFFALAGSWPLPSNQRAGTRAARNEPNNPATFPFAKQTETQTRPPPNYSLDPIFI